MVEFILLGEGGFHKSCGGAKKCNDPHPEHRARPAEGYGRGYAHYIARADTARERHAEGLERRDAVADAIFVLVGRGKKGAYHQSETPHLDKARAHGEVQPGADQEYDQGRTPDDVIDDRNNLLYHSIFGLLLQI